MATLETKVMVVGAGDVPLAVDANGSISTGTGSSPSGDEPLYRKVTVIGVDGTPLKVNADGSIDG